ncbi:potassium channel family protein [Sedimentitalea sp. XS_ASV28]|uniref:potassium channel family protein n=1 Tax=Sedimentitalea sp. XS_ASV28 TaxID=3241296 RepID=UPI0035137899
MKQISPYTVIATLIAIVISATIFFRHVEGWSWLDSYFFTVVTISTVGYGSLVPVTAIGKIGATILIFFGLGVFAVAIQQFALYNMLKHKEHAEWLIARLGHNGTGEAHPAANRDDQPDSDNAPNRPS